MSQFLKLSVLALIASSTLACEFNARSAEDYANETKALLASKNDEIKSCYDKLLEKDQKMGGVVAVTFKVEKKTGKVVDPAVDQAKTTAPEPLTQCVIKAMDGLAMESPDARDGMASFEYEFKANPPKQL